MKRAFDKKFPGHPVRGLIHRLFNANSLQEVYAWFDQITAEYPETTNWFNNKRVSWILAAVTCEASKIPINWWTNAPHHTGVCESSHFVDNQAVGRKQALLTAVLKSVSFTYARNKANIFPPEPKSMSMRCRKRTDSMLILAKLQHGEQQTRSRVSRGNFGGRKSVIVQMQYLVNRSHIGLISQVTHMIQLNLLHLLWDHLRQLIQTCCRIQYHYLIRRLIFNHLLAAHVRRILVHVLFNLVHHQFIRV